MKRGVAVLLCAALLALSSCALLNTGADQPPEGAWRLYFAVEDQIEERRDVAEEAAIDFEYRVLTAGKEPVPALVEELLAGPESDGLLSPFPRGVRLRTWEWEERGVHLDLSEGYGALSGVDRTIADYCLAMTLCQLEEVDYVHLTVLGEELPFWRADALREGDVLLSGEEDQPLTVNVALYYPRSIGSGLSVEYRDIVLTQDTTLAGAVMEAYFAGPSYQSLRSALPAGTRLRGVSVESGICYVNFSEEFLTGLPEEESRLLVYSVVNTLGSLEKVDAVQLQVEGESLTHYGDLPTLALTPDYTLEQGLVNQLSLNDVPGGT